MKKPLKKKHLSAAVWIKRHPFTLIAIMLAMMTLMLIVQLPRRMGGIERQEEMLVKVMQTYSEQQAERNVVLSELARVDDADYIEMLARREHGYGWYGETIYEVGNLEEVQAAQEIAE